MLRHFRIDLNDGVDRRRSLLLTVDLDGHDDSVVSAAVHRGLLCPHEVGHVQQVSEISGRECGEATQSRSGRPGGDRAGPSREFASFDLGEGQQVFIRRSGDSLIVTTTRPVVILPQNDTEIRLS
jgi:hypothetical protein